MSSLETEGPRGQQEELGEMSTPWTRESLKEMFREVVKEETARSNADRSLGESSKKPGKRRAVPWVIKKALLGI